MKRDPIHMQQDMLKTLITKDQLEATVARLGREITEDYRGRTPMLVAVLKGAFIFMADLVRQLYELGIVDASFIGLDSTPIMANRPPSPRSVRLCSQVQRNPRSLRSQCSSYLT